MGINDQESFAEAMAAAMDAIIPFRPEFAVSSISGWAVKDLLDRLDAAHKREVDALKQSVKELDAEVAAKDAVIKRLNDALAKEQERTESFGHAAKLREALVCLRDAAREFNHQIRNSKYSGILDKYTCEKQGFSAALKVVGAIVKANYAINAPARQCDVGTAEEQAKRLNAFCCFDGQKCNCSENCPFISVDRCELAWAQMPYNESEAEDGSK